MDDYSESRRCWIKTTPRLIFSVVFLCGKTPAAVLVDMTSSASTQQRKRQPFCLEHYYTTSAVRHSPVTTLDQDLLESQLQNGMQQLFAEAFIEIQQELAHEAASSLATRSDDPLAIVSQLRGRPRKKAPPKQQQQQPDRNGGGFIRKIPLPERLLRTQQQQAQLQRERVARMNAAAASTTNPYERRKPSKRTIWHQAMEEPTADEAKQLASVNSHEHQVTCSCGSTKVTSTGNITNRNSDMAKAETWGSKDRDDAVVSRYQCDSCGRQWNEEE